MEKYLFDLQLFAEEDNGQDPDNNEQGQNDKTGEDGEKGKINLNQSTRMRT